MEDLAKKLLDIQSGKGFITVDIALTDGTIAKGICVDLVNNPQNRNNPSPITKLFSKLTGKSLKADIFPSNNHMEIFGLKINGELVPGVYVLDPRISTDSFLQFGMLCITRISDGNIVLYEAPVRENHEQEGQQKFIDNIYNECQLYLKEFICKTGTMECSSGNINYSVVPEQVEYASKLAVRLVLAAYISNAIKEYASTNIKLVVKYINQGKEYNRKIIYDGLHIPRINNGVVFSTNLQDTCSIENILEIYSDNGELLVENSKEMAEQLYNDFITSEKHPSEIIEEAKMIATEIRCLRLK